MGIEGPSLIRKRCPAGGRISGVPLADSDGDGAEKRESISFPAMDDGTVAHVRNSTAMSW
jgi:hypothetical protein